VAFSVLVVDDDRAVAELCRVTLAGVGHAVFVVHSAEEALAALNHQEIDIILSDVRMPGMDGMALLRSLSSTGHVSDVVLMTAYGTIESAVEAVKLGAYDYIEKPFSPQRLQSIIQRLSEVRDLRGQNTLMRFRLASDDVNHGFVGASRSMSAIFASILRIADRPQPVLIRGETGTGKELVARAIHEHGLRCACPFIAVDCGALSPGVVESELFGHVRGAYTGTLGDRRGLLASSANGTLFLDEIGELSLAVQVKLLRVLQDREFRPLGGDKIRRFEARVIAATNRDLEKAISENAFRPELYYRLNVHRIHVPPLRARRDDIPLLIQHFIQKHGEGRVLTITREASEALAEWNWPGNVRELENCVIRMIASCEGRVLEMTDILKTSRKPLSPSTTNSTALEEAERLAIVGALNSARGTVADAARRLGISQATLYRKINTHGLKLEKSSAASAVPGGRQTGLFGDS
jgi:two-component system, NtrC family, response regulator AtoC